MLRIITGVPGSGKTFYSVNYLKQFVKFDNVYRCLNIDPSVLLVTNIEDIKVQHVKFEDWLEGGMLNIDKTRQYMIDRNYKRAIFIIDEAQRYFAGLRDPDIFYFFEYHRHLGLDIFLIVQTPAALPRRLLDLCEFIIDALPRTYAIVGFRYNMNDVKTGLTLERKMIRADQDVFKIYKSFESDETAKPKKLILMKWIFAVGSLVSVLLIAFILIKTGHVFPTPKKPVIKPTALAVQTPSQNKSVQPEPTQAKLATENYDYVFISDLKLSDRPHDNIKGIARTNDGAYYFFK